MISPKKEQTRKRQDKVKCSFLPKHHRDQFRINFRTILRFPSSFTARRRHLTTRMPRTSRASSSTVFIACSLCQIIRHFYGWRERISATVLDLLPNRPSTFLTRHSSRPRHIFQHTSGLHPSHRTTRVAVKIVALPIWKNESFSTRRQKHILNAAIATQIHQTW